MNGNGPDPFQEYLKRARQPFPGPAIARNLLAGLSLGTSPYALGAARGLLTKESVGEGIHSEREALKELPAAGRAAAEFAGGYKAPLALLGRSKAFQRISPVKVKVGDKLKKAGQASRPLEKALAPLRGGAAAGTVSGAAAAHQEGKDPVKGGILGGLGGAVPGALRMASKVSRGVARPWLNLIENAAKKSPPSRRSREAGESARRGLGVVTGRAAGEQGSAEPPPKTEAEDVERKARRWVNEALSSRSAQELRDSLEALPPEDRTTPHYQAVLRRLQAYE